MKRHVFRPRACTSCGSVYAAENYAETTSPFHPDGRLPICNSCLTAGIEDNGTDWGAMDNICRWADWAFEPERWTQCYEAYGKYGALSAYAKQLFARRYDENIDWQSVNEKWRELSEKGELYKAHTQLTEAELISLQEFWAGNYTPSELMTLQRFLREMQEAYPISAGVQYQNVVRMCKISLQIDQLIDTGEKFDHLLKAYETCMKIAEITPSKVSSGEDFETVGEIAAYLEKIGWMASFKVGEPKDVVDETIANVQTSLQQLVLGEPTLKEQTRKIEESLQRNNELEKKLTSNDSYETEAYNPQKFLERLQQADEDAFWDFEEDEDDELDIGGVNYE